MKRLLKLFFAVFILHCAAYADLGVAFQAGFTAPTIIRLSESKTVMVFTVGGSPELFTGINLRNSGTVQYAKNGIKKVTLYANVNLDGTSGSEAAAVTFDDSNPGPSTDLPLSGFSYDVSTSRNFAVVYEVAPDAQYNPSGATGVNTGITLVSITNGTNIYTVSNANASKSIPVGASGLIYLPDRMQSLLSSSSVISPGSIVPMLRFTLRAEEITINVNSISIYGGQNAFATNATNATQRINKVILLADDGDGEFEGIAGETQSPTSGVVCEVTLPDARLDDRVTVLNFSPIKLARYVKNNNVENRSVSEKTFYVLYQLGTGSDIVGKQVICQLNGGSGIIDGSSPSRETNIPITTPTGSAALAVKAADAHLIDNSAKVGADNGIIALGGQRNVKILEFEYDVRAERIKNVSIEIYNGGGTFRKQNDDGVNRVFLYESTDSGPMLVSVGDISVTNDSKCTFSGLTIEAGIHKYFVEYNVGMLVTAGRQAQAQLSAISAPGAGFSGYLPAPAGTAAVYLYPSQLEVNYVSTNVVTIQPGTEFFVDIGVRNIVEQVANPGSRRIYISPETRPVFYTNDIGFGTKTLSGRDISSQFSISFFGQYNDDGTLRPVPGATDTSGKVGLDQNWTAASMLRYLVRASEDLHTSGEVYIDAQAVYDTSPYNGETQSFMHHPVYYTKYFDNVDGTLKPAAKHITYKTPMFARILANVKNNDLSSSFKDYIVPPYVRVENLESGYNRGFRKGDKIPANSEMYIYLDAEDEIEPILYLNGDLLSRTTDFEYSSIIGTQGVSVNVIKLYKQNFTKQGTIKIAGYRKGSGTAVEEELLQFEMLTDGKADASNGGLAVYNLVPAPSPYNPDSGDMLIGFECSRAGVKYTVYIYDSTGKEIYSGEEMTKEGYNSYKWAGELKSGGTVGRGVYILRVKVDGLKDIVKKFGVK